MTMRHMPCNRSSSFSLSSLALALALLTTSACEGDASEASFDTEGWIDTMPPGQPPPNPNHQEGDEEDEGEEEGEDEGEEGAYWGIFGQYSEGVLSELEGELFAEDASGVELCAFTFAVNVVSTIDDCSVCVAAWTFELQQPEIEIEVGDSCASYGVDAVGGTLMRLGVTNANLLVREQNGGWEEIGEAFQEEGELILEWEHL